MGAYRALWAMGLEPGQDIAVIRAARQSGMPQPVAGTHLFHPGSGGAWTGARRCGRRDIGGARQGRGFTLPATLADAAASGEEPYHKRRRTGARSIENPRSSFQPHGAHPRPGFLTIKGTDRDAPKSMTLFPLVRPSAVHSRRRVDDRCRIGFLLGNAIPGRIGCRTRLTDGPCLRGRS